MRSELDLPTKLDKNFYYDLDAFRKIMFDLEEFVCEGKDLFSKEFAFNRIFLTELKANNSIEGYDYDMDSIKSVLDGSNPYMNPIVFNLYMGYKYIFENHEINKESLRELYGILSDQLLSREDLDRMGKYYREAPVYILKNGRLDTEPYEMVKASEIERYMDKYFKFLDSNYLTGSKTEEYIKSQILHLYFIYIHPYFDINGRTARTLSLWYLLNKECYAYTIFTRGINFHEKEYNEAIIKSHRTCNLNYFIEYMLGVIQSELKNEIIIKNIVMASSSDISSSEYQTLLYILNMKGNITVSDFIHMYNRYNFKRKPKEIEEEMINPLVEKGILRVERETKKCIYGDTKNRVLSLKRGKNI